MSHLPLTSLTFKIQLARELTAQELQVLHNTLAAQCEAIMVEDAHGDDVETEIGYIIGSSRLEIDQTIPYGYGSCEGCGDYQCKCTEDK